ncbi:DUF927 domain-containing protein [Methylovulum psychrotolerans]|uniref:DUF927 domain-containing protein n=1 Tax=Methylovulum psychrotolerans TaxID=1704499 RepID=A0A1Z4C2G4_9GAMM|nr:DUF927 domain-containing protein [Methylovulum psychrotolerans]ASF47726.1 hypothetical protein CEK71_17550 [Methylovulum psychrotolerans]
MTKKCTSKSKPDCRYTYKQKNNRIYVVDNSTNTTKCLTNFTVQIIKEIVCEKIDGNTECSVQIKGVMESGQILKTITLSATDFENGKWLRKHWGIHPKLNELEIKEAGKHLVEAIQKLNTNDYPKECVYYRIGLSCEGENRKFLFGNGAITPTGIELSSRSHLPEQLRYYQLPSNAKSPAIKLSIQNVFKLLAFSDENPNIGALLCVASFRAVISMWLPVDHWFFLVGKKATYKSSIAELIQAFFGVMDRDQALVNWKSTTCGLENLAKVARNGVLCVDDFVYPKTSNRASEFTQKADDLLRSIANGSPKSRATPHGTGIEDSVRLNCLVISTGEFPPNDSKESLHHRGIYVPFNAGDIELDKLSYVQELARAGSFACANVAFIQFLLSDYDKYAQLADSLFKKYRKQVTQELVGDARRASHIAGLLVAWNFFCRFAYKNDVISKGKAKSYLRDVRHVLIELMLQQEAIYTASPGHVFIEGLKQAFLEGKAHLIDSQTGNQPKAVRTFINDITTIP